MGNNVDYDEYQSRKQNAVDSFSYYETTLLGYAGGVVAGTVNDQSVTDAKNGLTNAVTTLSTLNANLKNELETSSVNASDASTNLTQIRSSVEQLRTAVEKERTLNQLRKEQMESLNNKDDSNYHSSWLGLFRPMKEESRIGLLVAAVGFFLLGCVGVYYAWRMDLFSRSTDTSFAPDFFRGGRYKNSIRLR
jgi:hypothetical protein